MVGAASHGRFRHCRFKTNPSMLSTLRLPSRGGQACIGKQSCIIVSIAAMARLVSGPEVPSWRQELFCKTLRLQSSTPVRFPALFDVPCCKIRMASGYCTPPFRAVQFGVL
eukprot:3934430-Rhodomonas_salina.1